MLRRRRTAGRVVAHMINAQYLASHAGSEFEMLKFTRSYTALLWCLRVKLAVEASEPLSWDQSNHR